MGVGDLFPDLVGAPAPKQEEPNNLELLLGNTVGKVPFLPEVLDYVARPFFAAANVANAGVLALQGRGGDALESLGDAGRNAASLLPFVDNPELEQKRTFKDVLTTAGVGDLGRVDLPLIGEVSGKGALGLGLDLFAAGKVIPRIGARVPGAPRIGPTSARIAEGLTPTKRGLQRSPKVAPSTFAQEAELGNRALVQMFDRPVVRDVRLPDALGGSALELIDTTRRGLAKTIFAPFNSSRGFAPEFSRLQHSARGRAINKLVESDEQAIRVFGKLEDFAKKSGRSEEEVFDLFLRGAERGGAGKAQRIRRTALADKLAKAEADVANLKPGKALEAAKKRVNKAAKDLQEFEGKTRVVPGGRARRKIREELGFEPLTKLEAEARGRISALVREFNTPTADGGAGLTRAQSLRAAKMVELFHVDKTMAPIAAEFLQLFRNNIRNELQAGIAVAHVADPFLNYVTRVMKPEAVEAIKRSGRMDELGQVFMKWYQRNPSTKQRRAIYEGMPIPDVSEFIRKKFPELFAEGVFETNPLKIAFARSRRMARGLSSTGFVEGTIGHYGRFLTPELKAAGWRTTEEIMADFPALRLTLDRGLKDAAGKPILTRLGRTTKGMAVPPDIAEALVTTMKAMADPKTPNAFISLYDKLTRTFKLGATALFPEFHVRNTVSNFWANYLGGVRNFSDYADAFRAMKSGGTVNLGNGVTMAAEEFLNRLKLHRLTGKGSSALRAGEVTQVGKVAPPKGFFPEGEKGAVSAAKLPARAAATAVRGAAKAGTRAGTVAEDWAKVAHVIAKMRQGMTMEEAVLSAKKFLFDYGDLTQVEKAFFRRIVPFYTWTRKNLPLQLENLFTNPGKVAQTGIIMRALQNGVDGQPAIDTTMVPEWMRRRFFGASKNDDDSVTIFSGLGIGLEDLAIFDRPVSDMLAMLNPLVKAPLQAAVNKDFFRDTDLDRAEIAPPILKHFGLAPGGKTFLDAIGFREVLDEQGEKKYSRANPRFLNFLRGIFEVGGVARAINTVGSLTSERATAPIQPLKFATALRVQHSDPRQQMKQHMVTLLEAYRDRLQELRRQGVTEEFRSFFVERDIVPDTPEAIEAKALIRELSKVGKALGALRKQGLPVVTNEEAVDVRRSSIRTGGR